MHYTGGLVSLASFAAAAPLPHQGTLWLAARVLLDGAGALFALYVLVAMMLALAGMLLRAGDRRSARRDRPAIAE
ncbi:MAG: hypothetical protein M3042_02605 [Actinomycetota bacterium]|nr:hypothetical protein [Actinomycetota bacterium]